MLFLFDSLFEKKPKTSCIKKEVIEGINFKFQKHQFSRSVKLSIREGEILVTLPKRSSFKLAKEFALSKMKWIKTNYKKKEDTSEEKLLRKKAKKILPQKLEELSKKYDFKYRALRLTNARRRWGSCSFVNNINLNINLANLDEELTDYVILHELCHTKIKNHGKKFWALVIEKMPDALERRKKLKKIRL